MILPQLVFSLCSVIQTRLDHDGYLTQGVEMDFLSKVFKLGNSEKASQLGMHALDLRTCLGGTGIFPCL